MVIVETEGGEAQPAAALGACEHQSLRLKTLTASRGGVGGDAGGTQLTANPLCSVAHQRHASFV